MSGTNIKVNSVLPARTATEASRAAPISLPAGSYDLDDLSKAAKDASQAKNDEERGELHQRIVDDLNQTVLPTNSLGVGPGYKRVDVLDERLDVTESRVVFDPDNRDAAEQAQADYVAPIDPAAVKAAADAPTPKGE